MRALRLRSFATHLAPELGGCSSSPVDNDGATRYKPGGGRAIYVIGVEGTPDGTRILWGAAR
jgi:hypothetical protein